MHPENVVFFKKLSCFENLNGKLKSSASCLAINSPLDDSINLFKDLVSPMFSEFLNIRMLVNLFSKSRRISSVLSVDASSIIRNSKFL